MFWRGVQIRRWASVVIHNTLPYIPPVNIRRRVYDRHESPWPHRRQPRWHHSSPKTRMETQIQYKHNHYYPSSSSPSVHLCLPLIHHYLDHHIDRARDKARKAVIWSGLIDMCRRADGITESVGIFCTGTYQMYHPTRWRWRRTQAEIE